MISGALGKGLGLGFYRLWGLASTGCCFGWRGISDCKSMLCSSRSDLFAYTPSIMAPVLAFLFSHERIFAIKVVHQATELQRRVRVEARLWLWGPYGHPCSIPCGHPSTNPDVTPGLALVVTPLLDFLVPRSHRRQSSLQ